jgi:branched-subunit amino acid ABC-type transport system permease component
MKIEAIVMQLVSGLSVGMVIFLIAVGLSIIFGTLKVINMAHGSLYMLGAYVAVGLTKTFAQCSGLFWLTLIAAPLAIGLVGILIEIVFVRRLYARDEVLHYFLLTFGLTYVVQDLAKIFWGLEYQVVPVPWPLDGAFPILGTLLPTYNLALVLIGAIVFVALWGLFRYTRLGRILRAVTYNREISSALGVNVPLVYTMVFALGCWLAGLGGALVAPMSAVYPGMDMTVIVESFIIVVIGGLGSLPGAFLGAIIFGLVNAFGILVFPRLAIAFGFILMAIVLIVRPHGLFGEAER